jgi:hypothetical protein
MLTRPRLRHDPHSQQRLRRFLHDPKSLTPAPTQKRNVNIRHVSSRSSQSRPNVLYLVIGALAVAVVVLSYQLYQDRHQPEGGRRFFPPRQRV